MPYPYYSTHWYAVLVAMVGVFVLGFTWYGPLFGQQWAKLMGLDFGKKPDAKVMRKAFTLQIIGLFLTAYVLSHSIQVWRPTSWGVGDDVANWKYGFCAGFFTWLGFYVPMQFGKLSWEGRPWKLFFINSSYDFLSLQLMAMILAYF